MESRVVCSRKVSKVEDREGKRGERRADTQEVLTVPGTMGNNYNCQKKKGDGPHCLLFGNFTRTGR
jgi:hypothetical protein